MTISHTARVAPERQSHRLLAAVRLSGGQGEDMATKMTYREQLLHPNWQRKRLEMLDGAGWNCDCCGSGEKTLHVHHKRYIKGRMAWEYEDHELQVLCGQCHEKEHKERELLDLVIDSLPGGTDTALRLLAGYGYCGLDISEELEAKLGDLNSLEFVSGQIAYMLGRTEVWPQLGVFIESIRGAERLNPAESLAVQRLKSF